ncbi:hypothetical protein N480_21935 [Pseudoalteromonas luteoviolacea S2607]|uniref:hypothetical protein n=1 Tax=Pseudoalteromonas luteoviolacea TaxID=43657 RepID=UPI0007B06779|nr:hypothetical protein [Pseudoalteromonas luteoviolacea]KZN34267.1 hypothetical protein N480_21935 [Pseudoalteromonas luteoviolacea S2607]
MRLYKSRLSRASILIWGICAVQTMLILSDVWPFSVESRFYHHGLEALTTAAIVVIAGATWATLQNQAAHKEMIFSAKLLTYGVLFCAFGDIVNFNLLQHTYRYDPLIKHDYLIDSIYVFSVGYGLILWSGFLFLKQLSVSKLEVIGVVSAVSIVTLFSYLQMRLPGTGAYVSILAGFYALLVAQCASVALLLLIKATKIKLTKRYYLPVIGLLLATLADALIGQFWLFGNQGQGYFPLIRTINWFVYISSSLLIIQLPWVYHLFVTAQQRDECMQTETLTSD